MSNNFKNNSLEIFKKFSKVKKQTKTLSNRCVIYTRVSSKEQAENNMSLATQLKACISYAEKSGYEIIEKFGGTYESAKTDNRVQFNKMLKFVKTRKNDISYIIVYSNDRFSRSGGSAITIVDDLYKNGIHVVSVTQPADISSNSGKLHQYINYLFSNYDNVTRGEKTVEGMVNSLMNGIWCAKPPIGYTTIKTGREKKIVINEKGKLIRKAFYWKAVDKCSSAEIQMKLKNLGLNLSHQHLSKIFRNPFYCGLISNSLLHDRIVVGIQEVLVSKEIFLQANDVLSKNSQGYNCVFVNENIPLKQFLKCENCGSTMPGYVIKNKNLWYYKCRTIGCCNNVSAKLLHNKFQEILQPYNINISNELKGVVKNEILKNFNYMLDSKDEECSILNKKKDELLAKIEKLEEKYIDDNISKEVYLKHHEKYTSEIKNIELQLEKKDIKVSNLENSVENLINFSFNLNKMWNISGFESKRRLQEFIFPKGIVFNKENKKCRTLEVNPLISYMSELTKVLEEKNVSDSNKKLDFATLVARRGIEPLLPE